ncbi:MAG: hypothetical protein NT167_05505, partial [Verrucomicrobia bacterium]|nr:hypothetical protein [Verrucomicrobiota bacterium]
MKCFLCRHSRVLLWTAPALWHFGTPLAGPRGEETHRRHAGTIAPFRRFNIHYYTPAIPILSPSYPPRI